MAIETISVTCNKKRFKGPDGKPVVEKLEKPIETSVQYDFGDSLSDAVAKHGEQNVFSLFHAKGIILVQDAVRRLLEVGKTPDEVTAAIATMKLETGVRGPKAPVKLTPESAKKQLLNTLPSMTPEERTAMLRELQAHIKSL